MIKTFIVPLLAIIGVIIAVYTVVQGSKPPAPLPPAVEPPSAPYEHFVAGSALVEASTQNIALGTPVGGVVMEVLAKVGDDVKVGQVLFRLDDRQHRAELASREANLAISEAQLAKLKLGTRPEELPQARARVAEAEAILADLQDQLSMWERVRDERAISADDLARRRFAVQIAQARADEAKAALALLTAGTWKADLSVAQAQVRSAQAGVEFATVELDRLQIRAPVEGRILQVNVRAGEFAQAGPSSTPHVLMGDVTPLHVRVDVDENDAWRVSSGAEAMAYVRGNKDIATPLTFVRFEPFVVPKRSLTGESTERVDTRVLQVIFSFDPKALPIYVGQQMDIYIKSDPDPRRRAIAPASPAPSK
jgi:HlyD family secretion protein